MPTGVRFISRRLQNVTSSTFQHIQATSPRPDHAHRNLPPAGAGLLQFGEHLMEREASWSLARRILGVGLQVPGHVGVGGDESQSALDAPLGVSLLEIVRKQKRPGQRAFA